MYVIIILLHLLLDPSQRTSRLAPLGCTLLAVIVATVSHTLWGLLTQTAHFNDIKRIESKIDAAESVSDMISEQATIQRHDILQYLDGM